MENKKIKKKLIIIVSIILAVIILTFVILNYVQKIKIQKVQEDNIKNNNFTYGNNNNNLVVPIGEDYGGDFVSDSDYIFFSTNKWYSQNKGIYKISKKDGKSYKIINGECSSLNLYKDKIYYVLNDESKLFCCDLDGNNRAMILEKVSSFGIENDTIYYFDDNLGTSCLYSCSLDGQSIKKLVSTGEFVSKSLTILKNKIFYLTGQNTYNLYEYDIYSNKNTKLLDDSISYYIPYENYIYYINKTDGDFMYKLDLNTMKNTRLDIKYDSSNKKPFIIYNNNIITEYYGEIYIYNDKIELLSRFDSKLIDSYFIDDNRIYGKMENISFAFNKDYYVINEKYILPYYDINI